MGLLTWALISEKEENQPVRHEFPSPQALFNLDQWTQLPGRCPNCGRSTTLTCDGGRLIWPKENPEAPSGFRVAEQLWTCTYCHKTTLMLVIRRPTSQPDRFSIEVRQVWPDKKPRELPAEAPQAMRSLYAEASVAEGAGARRGAAALYRAAVEELTRDQGATQGNLEDRIDALGKELDADLIQDLHEARILGNWSLHQGLAFSAEEVADVAELISQAVDQIYVEPRRREVMREKRAARRAAREAEKGKSPPGIDDK